MDWSGVLNSECVTNNCNTFSRIVETTLNKIAPRKTFRISKSHRHIEPWMTKGIERSRKHKLKLYHATLKKDCDPEELEKYKNYRNTYNRTEHAAAQLYYCQKAESYKRNTKELWKLINEAIHK